jgi:phage baseplate assembly protein W
MTRSGHARQLRYPAFQGRGWRFGNGQDVARRSVTLDKRWGRAEMVEGEEDIGQSIGIIIGTARGERLMRPEFGCGIHELVFEPISSALVQEIKATVRDALTKFEARIDLDEVSVSTRDVMNGFLEITIAYRVRTTNQVGNFVYPYYFREST